MYIFLHTYLGINKAPREVMIWNESGTYGYIPLT